MSTTYQVQIVPTINPSVFYKVKNEALAIGYTETLTVEPAAKFYLQAVYVSANGDCKAAIKTGPTATAEERRVFYLSKADANQVWVLDTPLATDTTDVVIVNLTNVNGTELMVAATVQGFILP